MKNHFKVFAALAFSTTLFTFSCSNDSSGTGDQSSQDSLANSQNANSQIKVLVSLTGNWRSESDTLHRIAFSSNTLYHIHDGKIASEEMIEIHEKCPADCGVEDTGKGCFTATVNGQKTCYRIIEASAEKLAYAPANDANKIMTFSKIGK